MDNLLTTKQVADKLGVSEGWVRMLCISGQLEGFKHGRAWAISPDAVERYMMLHDEVPAANTNGEADNG
jgi:excisionase family DNA binding protein